jgi:hypothetical protein
MMTFTEAEVAQRINDLETIEDTELRECAFNFWCVVVNFMKLTNSSVLKFEIMRDENEGLYGSVIKISTRHGFTSTAQLRDFAPETIESIRYAHEA